MRRLSLALFSAAICAVAATSPVTAYFGAALSLSKAFSPTTITSGTATVLTFTVLVSPGAPIQSNIGFVDTLPANLVVFNGTVGGTCANAAAATTVTAGGATITVANLQTPAGGAGGSTCTVTVNVTNKGGALGTCPDATFTNSSSNLVLTNIGSSVLSSCVSVQAAVPTVSPWVLLVMAAAIGAAGTFLLRRRLRAARAR